jgi:hypothetical protein
LSRDIIETDEIVVIIFHPLDKRDRRFNISLKLTKLLVVFLGCQGFGLGIFSNSSFCSWLSRNLLSSFFILSAISRTISLSLAPHVAFRLFPSCDPLLGGIQAAEIIDVVGIIVQRAAIAAGSIALPKRFQGLPKLIVIHDGLVLLFIQLLL